MPLSQITKLILFSGGGTPAISVSPSSWDAESIAVGEPVEQEFEITNPGSGTLRITLPITSDNAAFTITAQPGSTSLAPGASTTFTVQFSGALQQVYSGNISIVSNAASSPTVIAVTATTVYDTRILALNPQRYNKLDEGSGAVMVDSSANAFAGSYTGITWGGGSNPPMGGDAPFFDGLNDYADMYGAAFAAAFNPALFSVVVWMKVNAAFWSDATSRRLFTIEVNGSNTATIAKTGINTLTWFYVAGGTSKSRVKTYSGTGWVALGMTVNKTSDRMRAYLAGVQEGADLTALGTWAGALNSNRVVWGAADKTPNSPFVGYLVRGQIYNYELTAAQMASASVV